MNKEGYHCPTEEAAVGNETVREKLRKKYHIREGDVIKMKIEVYKGAGSEERVKRVVKVRVKEIHKHFITVIRPDNMIESFQWWDFQNRIY